MPQAALSLPSNATPSRATWHSSLDMQFRQSAGRTVLHHRHDGGLRALAAHYPEDDAVCHQTLVHPPGGLVGGDTLAMRAELAPGAHALVTTPGASRFYRSLGAPAVQTLDATLNPGARLEWLPLETIAYDACIGENRSRFTLAEGAELIAWDMLALGLPAADEGFRRGSFTQHIELPGLWLERGHIDAADAALLNSPGGLAGHTAVGTLLFASGGPIAAQRRAALLDAARQCVDADPALAAGATSPHASVVVLRACGHRIEPIAALFRAVWAAWRKEAWKLAPCAPRVWAT